MPYSAQKVANAFLAIAQQEGAEIDPLKLLKLVYIAHGWSLALTKRAMVFDPIEAWEYGPVIPSLYHAVREYRYRGIPGPLYAPDSVVGMDPRDVALINSVYRTYGHFSGGQLSNMTHQAGTPWETVWTREGRNSRINDDIIARHYEELARVRGVATGHSEAVSQ